LIEMIETVGGAQQASEIAGLPGVDAVFAASGDLGNFSGYKQGDPDCERLINVVHDAAIGAGKRLCVPSPGAIVLTSPASRMPARRRPNWAT
jgi:2-keto-3-deoxy-L-rhamnonate aldolase RhmA